MTSFGNIESYKSQIDEDTTCDERLDDETDTDDTNIDGDGSSESRSVEQTIKWRLVEPFADSSGVDQWFKNNKNWSKLSKNETENGTKQYYRCNQVKRRGPQCKKRIMLFYSATSQTVTLYEAS